MAAVTLILSLVLGYLPFLGNSSPRRCQKPFQLLWRPLIIYFVGFKSKNHFKSNNLPIIDAKMYDKKIFQIIHNDKKNINGKINFVLLKNIGNAFLKQNIRLEKIKKITK